MTDDRTPIERMVDAACGITEPLPKPGSVADELLKDPAAAALLGLADAAIAWWKKYRLEIMDADTEKALAYAAEKWSEYDVP